MDGDRTRRLELRLRVALFAAGILLAAAAAPTARLLLLDQSIFSDDPCLAPAQADCPYAPMTIVREPQPSASAALLEPPRRSPSEPRPLLRAELPGLIDYGPEVAGGRRGTQPALRIAASGDHRRP